MVVELTLASEEATLGLGRRLAQALPQEPPYPALLLQGELGAGKTTLVRGLVESLPGGEEADVASPSFTLLHLYPTRPPCAHLDIYRLAGQEPDAGLCEVLGESRQLVLVEWAQCLPPSCLPEDYLLLAWQREVASGAEAGRRVRLAAHGPAAARMLADLPPLLTL